MTHQTHAVRIKLPGFTMELSKTALLVLSALILLLLAGVGYLGILAASSTTLGANVQKLREEIVVVWEALSGRAVYESTSDSVVFERTYSFWVPLHDSNGQAQEDEYRALHDWLNRDIGGWTRWAANGESAESTNRVDYPEGKPGYYYQASYAPGASDNPAPSLREIAGKLSDLFGVRGAYLIEIRHRPSDHSLPKTATVASQRGW